MPPSPSSSLTNKLITVAILILVLVVPGQAIRVLIDERQMTRDEAVMEVSSKWGSMQTLAGPILKLRSVETVETKQDGKIVKKQTNRTLYFLPETLNVSGALEPELRRRGLYKIPLYRAPLTFKGEFKALNFAELKVDPKTIIWNDAELIFNLSDLKGVKEAISLMWAGKSSEFEAGVKGNNPIGGLSGVHANVAMAGNGVYPFEVKVDVQGSEGFYVFPLGKETTVDLTSTWANPSFDGAFLPENHEITAEGFSAHWKVLDFSRNYPQQWDEAWGTDSYDFFGSQFGVNLFLPVDVYQQTLRSVKYMILFVALTFLVYFLVEVINKRRIHPIQYLLVGFGLILFYILLLSLSEHFAFGWAYLMASGATIALITAYSKSLLGRANLTLFMGGALVLLYSFLYVLLRLVDYSLLMGSIGLFLILGVVMYITRNINWYEEA